MLEPIASNVLNGNHLGGRFAYSHRFRLSVHVLVYNFYIIKTRKKIFFILGCLTRFCDPAPTYSRVQWETQSYVVL